MPSSDDEYVQPLSDEDASAHVVSSRTGKTRSSGRSGGGGGGHRRNDSGAGDDGTAAGGFELSRTWENVVEGEDGTIAGAVEGLLDGGKRRRVLKDTTPLQRGIIRHLVIILDLSLAMNDKDFRPTRHLLSNRYVQEFVTEYFEQNPISQLAIIGMRDGLAVRVSDMSGNPNDHITALQTLREQEPQGYPSLQNALEMARGALFHAPSHGTREVLLIFGSLLSSDPGDIHVTINNLCKSRITCSVIGLSAEVAVCKTLVTKTNPALNPTTTYTVALNEQHYRELILAATTPPPTAGPSGTTSLAEAAAHNALLLMGFPSRTISPFPTFCACHSKPTRSGYLCPRCRSKVCALPSTCPGCDLTLILSTHLARSYHHLFPLQNWSEVSWTEVAAREAEERAAAGAGAAKQPPVSRGSGSGGGGGGGGFAGESSACFACLTPFTPLSERGDIGNDDKGKGKGKAARSADNRRPSQSKSKSKSADPTAASSGVSESGRYMCHSCTRFFCIDCDVYAHEIIHNCPGCQSREGRLVAAAMAAEAEADAGAAGMHGHDRTDGGDVVMGEATANGDA